MWRGHTGGVTARFPVEVERFAVAQHEATEVALDGLGMLADVGSAEILGTGWIRVTDLAEAGSLSLLGEPGAGKTTALHAVVQGIPGVNGAGTEQGAVLWVPMAEVADSATFRERVTVPALDRVPAARAVPPPPLTVVLDGLDECPIPGGGKVLAGLLKQLLGTVGASGLRLLVGCRSAEYPQPIHDVLVSALESFACYELAPLRRRDVRKLAESRGADADEFLREVARTGTGPLAALPLSLDLLLRHYSATRGLEGSAADLYETALRSLAGEPDPDRDPIRMHAPAEQVLAVASRLCCYLQLCGRTGFWTGPSGQVPEGDLDPYSLAGGHERQAGGPFDVSRQVIDATLRSGLFTARGPRRVVPAHAAFAGFLAARYLASRELSEVQLRALLTVTTAAGSGLIPALRETTAWLIALRPQSAFWVGDADLAKLAAYAAIIPNAETRSLMTERMLADPEAFLAGGWRRARNLAHPRLATQLLPILTALADPSAGEPPWEQSYLALTLASEADAAAVLPPLLEIAARSELDASLRALAARTAAALDADKAAPELRKMITEVTAHPDHDPDDEIRGTALDALWPAHLTAGELAPHLTRPKRDNLVGAYYMFRHGLPARLSDDDLPALLGVASAYTNQEPEDRPAEKPDPADEDFLADLVDRALACRDAAPVAGLVAAIVVKRMRGYRSLEVPAALDERDADGIETRRSRQLRRLLAAEVISRHASQQDLSQLLTWGWQPSRSAQERHQAAVRSGQNDYPPARRGLVDVGDLTWMIRAAVAAGPQEAQGYVTLLRAIYDPMDLDAQETAYSVEGTALWPAFAFWFDPVTLDSEEAELHKQVYKASQPRPRGWDAAPAHFARVLDLYKRAPGEPAAFADLLQLLQIDPATGQGRHSLDGDLTSRPGIRILPPDEWPDRLEDAARNYLARVTPPGPELLDQPDKIFWLAEVGYLALAYLVRREQAGATPATAGTEAVSAWAISILTFPDWVDNGIKRVLLARLAQAAPDQLPGLVRRLVAAHVDTGAWPRRLETLDAAWTSAVADVLAQGIEAAAQALSTVSVSPVGQALDGTTADQADQRISALGRTITILARITAQHGDAAGVQAAFDLISRAADADPADPRAVAARAASVGLLNGDTRRYWDDLTRELADVPLLRGAVLEDLADDTASPILPGLTDSQLGALWQQLAERWRYQDDPPWSSGRMDRNQQVRRFRDGTLATLKQRGTSEAVRLLRQLAKSNPDLPWLIGQAREAEETHRDQQWEPLLPADLTRMLEDPRSRLVRSSADLADLVAEAITDAAEELTRTGQLLWNNTRIDNAERWRPKSEQDVGAWLTERLTQRLTRSSVVVNREVLVRQTASTGLGLSVDIQADAPAASAADIGPARCRIELKGNWNRDLMTAMRSQLAEDYLIPDGLHHGIYVTAWFDAQLWNDDSDSRRRQAASRARDDTEEELAAQAESLLELGLLIRSVVIDIPRPAPSARAAM